MIVRLRHVKDKFGKDTSEFMDQHIHLALKMMVKDALTGAIAEVDQKYIFAGDQKFLKNFPPETKIVTELEIPDSEPVMCRDVVLRCIIGTKKVRIVDPETKKMKVVEVPDFNQFGKWIECVKIPENVQKSIGMKVDHT